MGNPASAAAGQEVAGTLLLSVAIRGELVLGIFAIFVARCMAVMLFLPFSAADKVLNRTQAIRQAREMARARSLAAALLFAGFALEVLTSLAILSGIGDRLAASVLAVYCVITALLWKQFWKKPDFRLQGESRGRETFWDFLKNFALAGGLLLLAFGTNAAGARSFFAHPLVSSQPYSTIDRGTQ